MALDAIVAQAREDVTLRKAASPGYDQCSPSDRSLQQALASGRTGFILECKKASPSQGLIRPHFDPGAIARAYAPHADAISVLTNARFFQGSHDHLAQVRDLVQIPVLCKDFVIDPWQVREARAFGADAILLMLSVLDDDTYRACAREADRLGMDILTEVHTEQEAARAVSLDARIIGINNRDLRTLAVDRSVTSRVAGRIPSDRLIVSESGIRSHDDVREARRWCDAFLVGTSLMQAPALEAAVVRLIYGVTKVCGLTRPADAGVAAAAGASHGGMIFAPESPRAVTGSGAEELRAVDQLEWVGVFVNAPPEEVASVAKQLDLHAVQLHGEETRATVERLRGLLPADTEIWKAVRVRESVPRLEEWGVDRLLYDAFDPGARGGTGRTFDWDLVRESPDRTSAMLSGGLAPPLVRQAESVGTWGLDVNSGVETAPGKKDPAKLQAFLAERRGCGHRSEVTG